MGLCTIVANLSYVPFLHMIHCLLRLANLQPQLLSVGVGGVQT